MTTVNKTSTKSKPQTKTLDSLPDILTAQDIADYLHISRRRVYDLFQIPSSLGGIPNFEIGLSKRVDKQDLISWLESLKLQNQNKKLA